MLENTDNLAGMQTMVSDLIKHLAVVGEASRTDVNDIFGNTRYASRVLSRYPDIFRMAGKGNQKSVRLNGSASAAKENSQLRNAMDRIDLRIWQTWERDMRSVRLAYSVIERKRAFRMSRLSRQLRLLGYWVDTYNRARPSLTEEFNMLPGGFYSSREVKQAKGIGANEVSGSRISGILVTGCEPYALYDFDEMPEKSWSLETEASMNTLLHDLSIKSGFGMQGVSKAIIAGFDDNSKPYELVITLNLLFPLVYKHLYLMPHDIKKAKVIASFLHTPNHISKICEVLFDPKSIVLHDVAFHAITKNGRSHIGVCIDFRAIEEIRKVDKTEKVTIYGLEYQREFYKKVFADCPNVEFVPLDEETFLNIMAEKEKANECDLPLPPYQ